MFTWPVVALVVVHLVGCGFPQLRLPPSTKERVVVRQVADADAGLFLTTAVVLVTLFRLQKGRPRPVPRVTGLELPVVWQA